ncbi:sensor histidine kinase [Cohnella faecalis]|nr:sensor histidine kinase [Cohnella faecalis]
MLDNERDKQKSAMDRVSRYVEKKNESIQMKVQSIYRDQQLSENLTFLLKTSYQEYVEHRLDRFNEGSGMYKGLDYLKSMIEDDPDIENILLFSTEKQFLYVNSQRNLSKLFETNEAHSYVPDAMALQSGIVSVPNNWVRKTIDQWNEKLYSMRSNINDVGTLKTVGQLLVFFRSEAIESVLSESGSRIKGSILVLSPEGYVIFDSSDRYYGRVYPFKDKLNSIKGADMLDESSYISTLSANNLGYSVVGILPKEEIAASYQPAKRLIILISGACILTAIVVPSLFVLNFAKRTNRLIRTMRRVETGDMTVRIHDTKEDEIGQISRGFNQMLAELTRHIDRVYKAEIKQKHTELTALQARINPHFLYNTLEVIRMRAISQGVTDVSEMIYSLAVLFKSFVHQQTVVSLREEMDNCARYLELFRIRYKDKFSYRIDYDPELSDWKMIKMSLQPIVENYIVHGMRTDGQDNEIAIRAVGEENIIRVTIQDNGIGVTSEKLERIRRNLERPENASEESSLGLYSVNERLKLMYGKEYGVEIWSEPAVGTTVILWFPYSQGSDSHV